MTKERLQKILSRAGLGSRRACEKLIIEARVKVNGQVASLGEKADALVDDIRVDGVKITLPKGFQYYVVYKPRKVLSGKNRRDPRHTVRDIVPVEGHLFVVGRLDVDSEGLMILTDDGELAHYLTHPRFGVEKEYRLLVARHPDEEQLETWRKGVVLEDGYKTRPADVRVESHFGKGTWLRVIMHEGHKRQIRRVAERIGLPVVKLVRVRIGSVTLGKLRPGEYRALTLQEVHALKSGKNGKKSPPKRGPSTYLTARSRR